MENYEAQIGKNIKEVRQGLGYSQEKVASLSGISNSTLSAYENSKKIPNLITIAKIARALDVSIERLYYGDDNISFVNSVPDEGRKIVNCIYVLWKYDVIQYYEIFMPTMMSMGYIDMEDKNGFYLRINKYHMSIKRLINSLNEYRNNINTYAEPEKYLEILLSSVATEINQEIQEDNKRAEAVKNKSKSKDSHETVSGN